MLQEYIPLMDYYHCSPAGQINIPPFGQSAEVVQPPPVLVEVDDVVEVEDVDEVVVPHTLVLLVQTPAPVQQYPGALHPVGVDPAGKDADV